MPFRIIRNDITRVKADAIVNTANPRPVVGSGTDSAIYKAAGEEALLAERRKIGDIAPGDAAATSAFALAAKYIIHTVGPVWQGGECGEFDTLRSCYAKSLALADSLGCASIAFPLIATGVYGFPKDAALSIALSEIKAFLEHSDMQVTLVVFGRGTYQLAAGLTERVEEYIDENYEEAAKQAEYGGPVRRRRIEEESNLRPAKELPAMENPALPETQAAADEEDEFSPDILLQTSVSKLEEWTPEEAEIAKPGGTVVPGSAGAAPRRTLEEEIGHLGESFHDRLQRMIVEKDLEEVRIYKQANIDRKLFSKLRCKKDCSPKKTTILALAIGMRLNLDDTRDLLASAGFVLTNSSKMDVIVRYCIENGIYDIFEVNALIFKFCNTTLN